MAFLLPVDGYVTYLTQTVSAGDTTVYVNQLPSVITAGYLTIFELDGITIRCKIKFTGVASSPTRLTGVTFISLTDYADTAITGTACPKNSKVALTDNIHYTGKALAAMNGTINMEGVPKLPASRTISDVRHMIDKEYADGLAIAGYSAFFVTQDGADPSLDVNVAAGEYIKEDGSNAYFAGAASVACADDDTNYVEMDTSGTVTVNQVGFTTGAYALAVVTTASGDITAIDDRRALMGTNDGVVDKIRTWSTVQSFTADNAQITTDPDSANDAVRYSKAQNMTFRNEGTGTSGEAITAGDAVYVKAADSKLYKTDADADESAYSFVGFAIDAAVGADVSIRYAKPGGSITGLTGLTAGSYYFLSGTAGAIALTPHANRPVKVGQATSTTELRICEPKFIRRGVTTISSATTFAATTGFYPVHIDIKAAIAHIDSAGGSVGDDTNKCISFRMRGTTNYAFHISNLAWQAYDMAASADENSGTVSSKSQTGFVLTCSTFVSQTIVQWVAYSE